MPYHARRILLVFATHWDDDAALQTDIERYEQTMRRIAILGLPLPEYFILVVAPAVSGYLQCTPEIQAYVKRSTELALKHLEQIGTAFGIPRERQCFAEGSRNVEARRVSKALNIDEVLGYSKGFVWGLALWETIRTGWRRVFNKSFWLPVRKQHRQHLHYAKGIPSHPLIKK